MGQKGQSKGWGKGIHEFGYPVAHPLSPYAPNYGQGWGQPSGFSLGGGVNPNMLGNVTLSTSDLVSETGAAWNRNVNLVTNPESEWNVVLKNKRGRRVKRSDKDIDSISLEEERQIGTVNSYKGEWEVIKVTVDSGAVDTVTPPGTAKYFPILETESSRRGLDYRAANGTKIKNHGARRVQGISSEFNQTNMIMNVADVKKTLASAFQIVAAGNKVVLDVDYSYIVDKQTGEKTTINIENGEFNFDLWVPAPEPGQPVMAFKNGVCAAVDLESDASDKTPVGGFIRQDERQ